MSDEKQKNEQNESEATASKSPQPSEQTTVQAAGQSSVQPPEQPPAQPLTQPPEQQTGGGKKKIKARVLAECAYGKPNDVVKVTQEEADACEYLDVSKEAVAYAEKHADATDT